MIASSVAIYNELLAERPELAGRLHEPMRLDARGEEGDGRPTWMPVQPSCFDGKALRTFFHSDYFRSVVRHADVGSLGEVEQSLLDRFEAIASRPDIRLDMQFQVGDIQWISNHTVVHARTAYEDGPGHRRHLLRLWLSLED